MAPAKSKKRTRKKKPSLKVRIARFFSGVLLCFLALTIVLVLIYRMVDPPTTPLMWIRWVENDFRKESPLTTQYWVRLNDVSPHLIRAVITAEDQKFFRHNGFDWGAIRAAFKQNFFSDKKSGASTISMQTARNVFLWQERTWLRKILEAYFTFLIETFWSKQRILEVYLNVIEWGDESFGCEAASRFYFNRASKSVSPVESAWMAAILPNPREWSLKDPPRHVVERQANILKNMHQLRLF